MTSRQPTAAANRGWTYTDRAQRQDHGSDVLDFYASRYPHSSRDRWLERIRAGQVTLDGRPAGPDDRLRCGQVLRYHRPAWREAAVPTDFRVLHADEHVLAVNKPSGLPTLPGGDFLENTLLHRVRAACDPRAAPLHRLGRATSGIVLFALSPPARRRLSADLAAGRMRKTYRALVQGAVDADTLRIEVPIGRVPYAPLGYLHAATAQGRPSLTLCRVLERRPETTLVEVDLVTGRPHQIRIHLAAVGHPLAGDPLYAPGGLPVDPVGQGRAPLPGDLGYHLHAMRLAFVHPHLQAEVTVSCPAPEVLQPGSAGAPGET
ncbi:MAG: RluA family pseudouridine synthase [Candidatus Latescibacterota bacterium]